MKKKKKKVNKLTFTITNLGENDEYRIDLDIDMKEDIDPFELVKIVVDGAMLISDNSSDPDFARRTAAQRVMDHINEKRNEGGFRYPITKVAEA